MMVVKRVGRIDQQDVDPGSKTEILEAVIQEQRIGTEFLHGIAAGLP